MDQKSRITELANLMDEFKLAEASIDVDGVSVSFKRKSRVAAAPSAGTVEVESAESVEMDVIPVAAPAAPVIEGTPISSPMTGIFYASPSPSSPPFVKEGDTVNAGQIVGLIEAMKVFNEIPSPVSGIAKRLVAESGQVVNPGDVLLYVG